MSEFKEYIINGMKMDFIKNEEKMNLVTISPLDEYGDSKADKEFLKDFAFPPFQIAIASKAYGYCYSLVSGATSIPREMKLIETVWSEKSLKLVYLHEKLMLEATAIFEFAENSNFIRQHTTVRNLSLNPITLTHFSSSSIQGIASGGDRVWYDDKKIKIHYCRQVGQGEGQWRSGGLEELGMFPSSVHNQSGSVQFMSVGSRSTGRLLPMAVIENTQTNECWYFQIESSTHWHFEIGNYGINNQDKAVLFFHTNTADERYLGWKKILKPNEEYSTCVTGFGCCKGGFENAVSQFTLYRRHNLKKTAMGAPEMPLIFNDYMNCLWADPSAQKLIPLINKASSLGMEIFCIDAGWFSKENDDLNKYLGDWTPNDERFGEYGLKGIIDEIKSKGMIPGVWLELEVCGENSNSANFPDDWFIRRNGCRVLDGPRLFYNFTNPKVCEHLMGVVDNMINLGVGYIKNDYNGCLGNGDDCIADSASQGQIQNVNAFYNFIDSIRNKYPELILENCASGALRQDYGMLSHFHLQSNSDQEIYHYYPSIIQGESAILLPEHNGVWAYPYPLLFNNREVPHFMNNDSFVSSFEDGEETIFNMVNGMCGVMLLSGHIEYADSYNTSLIKEAVLLHKRERSFILKSVPVYPDGIINICNRKTWACFGYVNYEKTRMLLTVWRLDSDIENYVVNLDYFNGKNIKVRLCYPQVDTKCYYEIENNMLNIKLPGKYMARAFEISTY